MDKASVERNRKSKFERQILGFVRNLTHISFGFVWLLLLFD